MLHELKNIGHLFHLTTWIKQDYHYNSNLIQHGRSSLTNEKDHHYFLNRFVCVGEFFDG